jgi:hypothetical protein
VDKAVALLAHGEQHRYFFDRLENPEWLLPLKAKGFFSSPPQPIRDESRGTIAFPMWPESRYLARMAGFAPTTVLDILLQIPDTENVRVHSDLVQAALAIPPNLAAQVVPKAITWIQSNFKLLSAQQELGALISHLANGGQVEAAMELAKTLLAVRADPRVNQKAMEENSLLFPAAQPLCDLWAYEQVVFKNVPDLIATAGQPAVSLLCDVLDDAVRLSRRSDEDPGPEDYSYIWRPAIERGQSPDNDVRGILISAVRDAIERRCEQDPSRVEEIVRELENRLWRVFHRLALHVLRLFADAVPALVAERLSDPEHFDLPDFRREYNLLANERFRLLETENQHKILAWIEKGLDVEFVKVRLTKFTGGPVTDQEASLYVKQWQADRLAPISGDLPEDWKERYAQIVKEVGPGRDPSSVRTITGGAFAPKSPLSADGLRKMTVEQVVDYLRSWVPSGELMGESMEGLGDQFAALVAAEPERYSAEAERFNGLDPTYIRELLQALWQPAKEGRAISWPSLLNLCGWVTDQPRAIPGRKGGLLDRDPDWGWARNAIAKLLSEGFDHDSIPFDQRDRAWGVVERLTEDPMPRPEDDARYGENTDPASYSINTTRGEAMHAVVRYALWVRRCLEKEPDGKARRGRGFDEMPEVRSVLERHLDPNYDPSIAIRAVYGQLFATLYFLDRNWTEANIARVFPHDDASKRLRDVAWGAYVIFCQPYNEIFDALLGEYRRAIETIGAPSQNWHHLGNPDSRLAEHLMIEYWWGHLDWEKPEGLMASFYTKADAKLRSWALEFIGRSLREPSAQIAVEVLERLKNLWATRVEAVRPLGKASPESEELRGFAWWFVSKRFDDEWAIDQVRQVLLIAGKFDFDDFVVERLAELARHMPVKTVECLSMIVEGDKEGWGVLGWRDHARTILSVAIGSGDPQAKNAAVVLINRLGSRGYFDFRDLLPPNSAAPPASPPPPSGQQA